MHSPPQEHTIAKICFRISCQQSIYSLGNRRIAWTGRVQKTYGDATYGDATYGEAMYGEARLYGEATYGAETYGAATYGEARWLNGDGAYGEWTRGAAAATAAGPVAISGAAAA